MEALTISGETLDLLSRVRMEAARTRTTLESALRQSLVMYLRAHGAMTPELEQRVTEEVRAESTLSTGDVLSIVSEPRG